MSRRAGRPPGQSTIEILAALQRNGGVRDERGGATAALNALLPSPYGNLGSLSVMLRSMENDGMIARDARNKRTYEIVVVEIPEGLVGRVEAVRWSEAEVPDDLSIPPALPEEESKVPSGEEMLERFVAHVIRLLTEPSQEDVHARLASALESSERYRLRNRELESENEALTRRCQDLQGRLGRLDANLQAALRGASGEVAEEINRRWGRLMREEPHVGRRR